MLDLLLVVRLVVQARVRAGALRRLLQQILLGLGSRFPRSDRVEKRHGHRSDAHRAQEAGASVRSTLDPLSFLVDLLRLMNGLQRVEWRPQLADLHLPRRAAQAVGTDELAHVTHRVAHIINLIDVLDVERKPFVPLAFLKFLIK